MSDAVPPLVSESPDCGAGFQPASGAGKDACGAGGGPRLPLPQLLRGDPPPFWHGVETNASAAWTWILAASIPAVAGVIAFGAGALVVLGLSIATALSAQVLLGMVAARPLVGGSAGGRVESQALLTGLLVALTLPPETFAGGWHVPVVAALLAMLVGQTFLGGYGNHLWHPAALARVFVEILFGAGLRMDGGAGAGAASDGAITTVGALVSLATGDPRFSEPGRSPITVAIRDYLPPWGMTLFGGGGAGPTSPAIVGVGTPIGGHVIALVVAALILGWRGHVRGWCIVAALTAAAVAACVLPIQLPPGQGGRLSWFPGLTVDEGLPVGLPYVLHHLTAGELLIVILLLAGDSVTTPLTSRGQRWFGAGVGGLAIALRLYGMADTAGYWALLAMNTLVPLIDWRTRRRVYGT